MKNRCKYIGDYNTPYTTYVVFFFTTFMFKCNALIINQ